MAVPEEDEDGINHSSGSGPPTSTPAGAGSIMLGGDFDGERQVK